MSAHDWRDKEPAPTPAPRLSLDAYRRALLMEIELDDYGDVASTLDWIRHDYPDEYRRIVRTIHGALTDCVKQAQAA